MRPSQFQDEACPLGKEILGVHIKFILCFLRESSTAMLIYFKSLNFQH